MFCSGYYDSQGHRKCFKLPRENLRYCARCRIYFNSESLMCICCHARCRSSGRIFRR